MMAVIDTSSLLSLVRYYLPFDENAILYDYIKRKFMSGEVLIVDGVYDECRFMAKGIVVRKLSFIGESKQLVKTDALIAPAPGKFLSQVDNNFVVWSQKNRLTPTQYESQKSAFLKSADLRQIILCLDHINKSPDVEITIITEETEGANDNKLFKKIPAICGILGVGTMTLPELFRTYTNLHIQIS
jgi:hypothetical protein